MIFLIQSSNAKNLAISQEKKVSTMSIGKYLTKDNKMKAVKLRGLPFNVTEEEILEFFKNYNIVCCGVWAIIMG